MADDNVYLGPQEEGHRPASGGSATALQEPDTSGETNGGTDTADSKRTSRYVATDPETLSQEIAALGEYSIPDLNSLTKEEVDDLQSVTIDQLGLNHPSCALRIIHRYGDQLMLVKTSGSKQSVRTTSMLVGDSYAIYTLHQRSGRWEQNADRLLQMSAETHQKHANNINAMVAADLINLTEQSAEPGSPAASKEAARTYRSLMWRIQHLISPQQLESTLKLLPAVWLNCVQRQEDPENYGVTTCDYEDLDSDTRYIGCNNTVIDITSNAPLDVSTAREKLITASTGVDYNPNADPNEDVDKLFAPLGEELADHFLEDIAYCLHGRPNRRWRAIISDRNSAKTTIMNAILHTLGDYSGMLGAGALAPDRRGSSQNNATPDMATVMKPIRIAWSDEMEQARVDPARLKALSGGGSFTWRRLYGQLQDTPATATIWFCGNNFPTYGGGGLNDEALADRFRGYILPQIPKDVRDPEMLNKWKPRHPGAAERRERLLVELLYIASQTYPESPPTPSEEIAEMSETLIRQDLGDVGSWIRDNLVPAEGDKAVDKATTTQLWTAALLEFAETGETEVNGMDRNTFMSLVRTVLPALPKTTTIRVKQADGSTKPAKGWKGWTFIGQDRPFDED